MSKLDGNERWKGKMLLTEHQEQYEKRDDKPTGRATMEEMKLIRDAVLYPHMMTMVQRSIEQIGASNISLHELMKKFMQLILDHLRDEQHRNRKELVKRNIRILSDEMYEAIHYYQYKCRGYEDRLGLTREVLKTTIADHLTKTAHEIVLQAKER